MFRQVISSQLITNQFTLLPVLIMEAVQVGEDQIVVAEAQVEEAVVEEVIVVEVQDQDKL
jgi:hypothetical protein